MRELNPACYPHFERATVRVVTLSPAGPVLRIILLFATLFAIAAGAQTLPPTTQGDFLGEMPYVSYHGGDIDSINLATGNLVVHTPLLSYPQMTAEDFAALRRAGDALWPDAILSNSAIILGLARLAAKDILKRKSRK